VSAELAGRVALVTGAGSGIGRASAVALARAGAAVVVADVDDHGARTTTDLIIGAGGTAAARQCDVTDEADVDAAVAFAVEEFGGLHVAHNNAGINATPSLLADVTEADFDRVIAVDLTSVFLCMKAEITWMLEHGGGVIVNTSSGAGLIGYPTTGPYVAAKHGVIGLTKTAALEYGRQGVRVNAVCPGTVRTPMVDVATQLPGLEEQLVALHPIGRIGEPEEIANAVLWLCSDDASFVLGHALAVDGGYVVP